MVIQVGMKGFQNNSLRVAQQCMSVIAFKLPGHPHLPNAVLPNRTILSSH